MVAHESGDKIEIPKETLDFFGGDELRARVFYEKYTLRDYNGRIVETTPEHMWRRLAGELSSVEETDAKRIEWNEKFYSVLNNFKFIPGGRIMFGTGQKRKVTLLNCYVIPVNGDSIESIFEWCKEAARTYSFGGGVGTDISILRPRGAPVNNSAIFSTGSVSFMNIMSETTGVIGQAGRRGALMITISVEHPDIFEFIKVKRNLKTVRYANISVRITDKFMRAVEKDEDFTLTFESATVKKIERKIKARELWKELVASARDWAEPGLIFWDNVTNYSPSEYNGMNVISTNPCSEQPLQAYGACDLGHVNLKEFVTDAYTDKASINWNDLETTIRYAVRFLDNVLTYNDAKHPLSAQSEASRNSRRIGLGFTGLADMLLMMKIKYDTEESLKFIDNLMDMMKSIAYDASIELAKEKGSFPLFDVDKHMSMPFVKKLSTDIKDKIKKNGLRNVAILTIAPVGSGSALAGTSSGIEPLFAFAYTRRSESLSNEFFKVYHPSVEEYMKRYGVKDASELPDFFVPAHKIQAEFRVRVQGIVQKHIDSAISSTVNLPESATTEDVEKIYFQAWKSGCKGITVYREGSREGILITEDKEKDIKSTSQPRPQATALSETRSISMYARPRMMFGQTVKFKLLSGSLYVTANGDEDGIKEVFVNIGRSGTDDKSYTEAIGRLISMYLQKGGDVKEVVNNLKGIQGNTVIWDNGVKIQSIPDAIAKGVESVLSTNRQVLLNAVSQSGEQSLTVSDKTLGVEMCPECKEESLVNEAGCIHCNTCGYSKCD